MAIQTPTLLKLSNILPMPPDLSNIVYQYIDSPFITTIIVDTDSNIISCFITSTYDSMIDWGDNTYDILTSGKNKLTHVYKRLGIYIIHMYGEITHIIDVNYFSHIREISQWGNLSLSECRGLFKGHSNLKITAVDSLNLQYTTDLSYMFDGCKYFTGDLSRWDVSNIVNMKNMFAGCLLFNSDLSKWNVSKVTNMEKMFYKCNSFNSNINNWNVKNVFNAAYMFYECNSFKFRLSKWDVSNVIHMEFLFDGCPMAYAYYFPH